MSEWKIARTPQGPRYGEMRGQALSIWRGPGALQTPAQDGTNDYGWSVLNLAALFDDPLLLESRIVYAHLFDTEQQSAVLRAVAWDDRVAIRALRALRALRDQGQTAPLTMPVRFVRLPLAQLEQWLAAFKDLAITADQTVVEDTTLPIRRLRIEWEYTSCVIEKVWKGEAPEHAELLKVWTAVWQEMGEALRSASPLPLDEVTELFDTEQPDTSVYRPQEYTPDWLPLP